MSTSVIVPIFFTFNPIADGEAHIVSVDGQFEGKSVGLSVVGAEHGACLVAGSPAVVGPSDVDFFGVG